MNKYDILRNAAFKGYAAALHHIAGIDWNERVDVIEYRGTFTALKLRKAATAAGIEPAAPLVCVTWWKSYPDTKRTFMIYGDNVPVFSLRPDTASCDTARVINDYFNKSTWNEYRTGKWGNGDDIITIIIAQSPRLAALVSSERTTQIHRDAQPGERLHNIRVINGVYKDMRYISQFDAVDDRGKKYHYDDHGRCYFGHEIKANVLTDIVDKSGYYVRGRREYLINKAARIKADKERAAAAAVDLAPYIADVKTALYTAIQATRDAYSNAATLAEFEKLAEINDRWRGLTDLWKSCDRFTATTASEYSSPAKIASRAASIIDSLRVYTEKLNNI